MNTTTIIDHRCYHRCVGVRSAKREQRTPRREDIERDEFLVDLYAIAYRSLHECAPRSRTSRLVEIGAGPGPSRALGHQWIRTDIRRSDNVMVVNRAENLPFLDGSIGAIVLKDTWHHIPDISAFLREGHRVLEPGGVIAAFDPYWSPLGRFVYRFLHHEPWDTKTDHWTLNGDDPDHSNQALSYLMLRRDRSLFDRQWGDKYIVTERGRHIGPSFLLSGGVSRRTRVSGRLLARLLRWEERRGQWFDSFRFFHVFTLTKR